MDVESIVAFLVALYNSTDVFFQHPVFSVASFVGIVTSLLLSFSFVMVSRCASGVVFCETFNAVEFVISNFPCWF
jgi:hypothetical protein